MQPFVENLPVNMVMWVACRQPGGSPIADNAPRGRWFPIGPVVCRISQRFCRTRYPGRGAYLNGSGTYLPFSTTVIWKLLAMLLSSSTPVSS